MGTVRNWTITAIGAAGAGAGLALLRRSRPSPAAAPRPSVTAPPPAPPDPSAALDAARDRLRRRADELRAQIESAGGAPAPPR
jgi:hypothetical protein